MENKRKNNKIFGLKAYYRIAISEFSRKISYRASFYVGIIGQITGMILYCLFWNAVYKNSESQYISGFTRRDMIYYVILAFIISNLLSSEIAKKIGDDVRDGSISMMLIKPISYRANLLSYLFGDFLFKFLFSGLIAFIGIYVYDINSCRILCITPLKLILFAISIILSLLIYAYLDFCFGMIVVRTTYSFGMLLIKGAILSFLSGQVIPYDFFPHIVKEVLEILPFSTIVYSPVMIFLGKNSVTEIIRYIFIQIFWTVILAVLGQFFWKKNVKKMTILGG